MSASAGGALRITYVDDVVLPSARAAPIQIVHTCRALAARGAQVTVVVRALRAPADEVLAQLGVAPHPSLALTPLGAFSRRALRGALQATRADGAHVVLARGESGLRVGAAADGVPFVYEAHRLCHLEAARRWQERLPGAGALLGRLAAARMRARERRTVAAAAGVVCLTTGVERALRAAFDVRCPMLVLPSGTAIPREPPPPDDARDIDVLYAGKLERRKGVHDLVAAMRALPRRVLWLAGGAPREQAELQRLAAQLGVTARVRFLGRIAPAAVPPLLRRARVAVCPLPRGVSAISEHFTSPLKVLEAMAHGVPLVVTDVPALRAIVDERTAAFALPSDPASLAAQIGALLDDRARAHALAGAARAEVERYAWERRGEALLRFLARTVGR